MTETEVGVEILNLSKDFPPVSTETWECVIARDLKGADYEKKLVWKPEEGIAVWPYYSKDALSSLGPQLKTAPDYYPFVRGTGQSWEIAQDAKPGPKAIRVDLLHEAGAHAIQELGYGIAAGIERLAALTATLPVDTIAEQVEFVFAVGPTYFFEIAKFRAARLLWAQVVSAFGARDERACRMRLCVRTPRRNKSAYDRYSNLLRVTTEAMAAAIGGCDQLTVKPFGFDPHLALNVQRILKEESHLDAVADPAGGSYFIEALTDTLAREAWKLLQQVEAEGGYAKAMASGSIVKALAETCAARRKAYSSRKRALVGVNNYPNVTEKTPGGELPAACPSPLPQERIAEPFEEIRQRTTAHATVTGRYPKILLLKRGDVKMKGARANFAFNFFGCAGFDLEELEAQGDLSDRAARESATGQAKACPTVRGAQAFGDQPSAVSGGAAATPGTPRETQREQHSNTNWRDTDADLIVLCSSDPEYLEFAREVCPQVKAPVLVAGNPKEQIDALQAAGVQGFVHIFSDAIQTLTQWQDRLGMRSSQ